MVIKLAIDTLVSSWKKISVSIFMMIVSLLLFLFTVIVYKGQKYAEQSCEETLAEGINNTGFIRVEDENFNSDSVKEFNAYVNSMDEVRAYGNFVAYGINPVGMEELLQMQIDMGLFEGDYYRDSVKMSAGGLKRRRPFA